MRDHPTVVRHRERQGKGEIGGASTVLDGDRLRRLALDCGADDAGLVEIGRPELADEAAEILRRFPATRTLLAFACKMNRGPLRSPARSVANREFHDAGDAVNEVGRRIVAALEAEGVGAVNPPMGFPMETEAWPGRMWVVSHKPVAVAAGLGRMGIHRNVIHPKFGNFILLGTILIDADVSGHGRPVDFNPCLTCKLCVAACPVGAIGADGHFDVSACYHHNYREFMGGFADWVETVAESADGRDYRSKVDASETVSMWQSLGFGPNYKAAYCLSVCPAGEDVIGPFLDDRPGFLRGVVDPLTSKPEPIYVVPGSDAQAHVARRFPRKTPRPIRGSLIPRTIDGFLSGMPLTFQRGASAGLDAVYHFTFTGDEPRDATVVIRDRTIRVVDGHEGTPDLRVVADARTWLGFLAKERSLVWALLRRRIRLKGSPRLLAAFGRCFPS